ncbi:hypothetical protein DRP77_06755 [Candidatus Poribacteria bacterium]|nr:MAG: hypothetical protein DRP77_06755 [Candidatus Poribacteria bacterium]
MSGAARLEDVYEPIRAELEAVRRTLTEQLRSGESLVDEICRYVASDRGKLLRPALFFLSLRSLGRRDLSPELIHTASSIELIHIASLIHDDIIDGSPTRRGRESLWKRFGLESAVVFVDLIFSRALRMLSGVGRPEVWEALAEAVAEMCEGEILQIHLRGRPDVCERDCLRISLKKTASLFSTACALGAVMAEGDGEEIERFAEFGRLFGLAYQMADDLRDLEGEDAPIGEPTLPSIELERRGIKGIEAIAPRIERYLGEAWAAIAFLQPSPYKDSIGKLIDWLTQRARGCLGRDLRGR